MLRLLAPGLPPRTIASHLTTINLDNGRSKLVFNTANSENETTPKSLYLVTNHLPPAPTPPTDPKTPNSSLCPPFHIHLKEDETFHVISGQAKFLLLDQYHQASTDDGVTTRIAEADSTVTIPRGQIHTFRNASTSDSLVIEFGFSPLSTSTASASASASGIADHDTEKAQLNSKMLRFFRNTQLYRSDCTTHSLPRSLLQVLLFNYHGDVTLVPNWLLSLHRRYPMLRGLIERSIAPTLGWLTNVLGGVILGKWMFGFRASYPEYYNPEHSQVRPDGKSGPKHLSEEAGEQQST